MSRSTTLFSCSGSLGITPVAWTKKILIHHFSSDAEAIAAAQSRLDGQIYELFLIDLQSLEQRAKRCIELRGIMLNKSRVCSL